jgi:hypothetical protein
MVFLQANKTPRVHDAEITSGSQPVRLGPCAWVKECVFGGSVECRCGI